MRTAKHHTSILTYAVLATAAVLVVGPGWALAGFNQDNQAQYQDQGNPSYQPQSRSSPSQGRDMRLEQQIASRLRQQGYGTQGEIMILATGNRVILLGTVPDDKMKDGVEKVAKQIATRQSIDNRLHVNAQSRRLPDAELTKDTHDKLSDDLSQNVQVRAQNGTVTLQGHVDNWRQVADAIDAAFAAGAVQVNSQFSVASAGGMAQGGAAGGRYPSYGYAQSQPGQPSYTPRGRSSMMGGQGQATGADLRLAQQVADQLRQQLPQRQNVQPVQPQSIYVMVRQGNVTLHGYVQSSGQKEQAEQIVQSIQGVQNVTNDLAILSSRGTAGQGTGPMGAQQGYSGAGSRSGAQQGFGNTSSQGSFEPQGYIPGQSQQGMSSQDQSSSQSGSQQSFGGMAGQNQQGFGSQSPSGRSAPMGGRQAGMSQSDRALAQQVVQQLKQELSGVQSIQIMRPGTIYVMATQGTIMLHGFVQSNAISQQATQIARAVPGVRNIESTLRAGGAMGSQAFGYVPGQEQQQGAGQGMSGRNQGMQNQNQDMMGQNEGMQSPNQGMQGSAQMRYVGSNTRAGANQSNQPDAANQGMYGQNQGMYRQGQGMAGQMGTGPSSQSDMALAQQIAQRLRQQLTGIQNVQVARPGTIYVIVSKGAVTLDGLVSNNNQKQKAEQVAKSVSGVQNVKNSLSISAGSAGSQAYGYMPSGQDQGAGTQYIDQPYGNQQSGNQYSNQQSGNRSGNQAFGYIPPDEDQSGMQQYRNEQPGDQESGDMSSGNEQFGNQSSADSQYGDEFGDQESDEGQAGDQQPDQGTY